MSLEKYHAKRTFKKTAEPKGKIAKTKGPLKFMVHKHAASQLHYDLRLELDGVLLSWAIPKGPSMNPHDKHLAVHVEDHPYDYKDFEGVIPEGEYGAGPSMIWDRGTYSAWGNVDRVATEKDMRAGLKKGHLTFILNGQKLKGEFALVNIKKAGPKNWLIIKKGDEFAETADILKQDKSVESGKTISVLASEAKQSRSPRPKASR